VAAARDYYYHIPSDGYAGKRPVLIFLHGDGGSAGAAAGASQYWGCTDPDHAIVVAAQGPEIGGYSWNQNVTQTNGSGRKDAEYISSIIADAIAQGNGDAGKVYMTGESAGGTMIYTYLAILTNSKVKSALVTSSPAAVAPNAGGWSCDNGVADANCKYGDFPTNGGTDSSDYQWAGGIYHVHGTADPVVDVPDINWGYPSGWANVNAGYGGVPTTPETFTIGGHTATVYQLGDPKYLQVMVAGGGHVIPDMESRIWAFLKKY
jgi:poly(3-hydroxybutyrate) depolymerase